MSAEDKKKSTRRYYPYRRRKPQQTSADGTVAQPSPEVQTTEPGAVVDSKHVSHPKSTQPRMGQRHRQAQGRNRAPVEPSMGDQIRKDIRRGYECMVCMSEIKFYQAVWSCKTCYKLFHMSCTHEVCLFYTVRNTFPSGSAVTHRRPKRLRSRSNGDARGVSSCTSSRSFRSTNVSAVVSRVLLLLDKPRFHAASPV